MILGRMGHVVPPPDAAPLAAPQHVVPSPDLLPAPPAPPAEPPAATPTPPVQGGPGSG